jgi:hypothetical protein
MSSLADTLAILTPTPPPRVVFSYAVSGTRAAPNRQTWRQGTHAGTLMLNAGAAAYGLWWEAPMAASSSQTPAATTPWWLW